MSVNDAKDSSEVNRGESNISVAPNAGVSFAMQNNANSTNAQESSSEAMVERKTTSLLDITDPIKRRKAERESRKNKLRTHKKASNVGSRKHRSFPKRTILALLICSCLVGGISLTYSVKTSIKSMEEELYDGYIDEASNEPLFSDDELLEMTDDEMEQRLNDIINSNAEGSSKYFHALTYYSAFLMSVQRYDDSVVIAKRAESSARGIYQDAEAACLLYKNYNMLGDTQNEREYADKINRYNSSLNTDKYYCKIGGYNAE